MAVWCGSNAVAEVEPPPPEPAPPVIEAPPEAQSTSEIALSSTPPGSATIDGLLGHPQTWPLSCESRSAVDWASFFGVQIDEPEFLRALPVSTDPDKGFVGVEDEGRLYSRPLDVFLQSCGALRNMAITARP